MKNSAILILTLFSFEQEEIYEVETYSCEENTLRIKQKENWFNIHLFNVNIEEGVNICTYINGEIRVEFETAVQLKEPYEAYVFVNHVLLQEQLIEDKKATIKIQSPAYKYDLEVTKEMVMANVSESKKEIFSTSKMNALLFLCIYSILVVMIIVKKYKRT